MTYVYTTDLANSCIVSVGDNEEQCRAHAEQCLPFLPGAKIMGSAPLTLGMVFNTNITLLSKARPDDVLIRKILGHFGKDSKIELHNDLHEDGTITKHFLVEGEKKVHLQLKTPAQVADYEQNGLNDAYVAIILKRLEPFVKKGKPESEPGIEIATADNGQTEALEAYE